MTRNIDFELNFNNSAKPLSRWKIFLFTFVVVFVLTSVQNLFFKNLHLLSPLPFQNTTLEKIIPKLEEKSNNFRLKKTASLVEPSFASSDFENISAYVSIDYDTGEILYEKKSSKKLPIASLTKIMTTIVALDLSNPNQVFTVSKNPPQVLPTRMGLLEGEKITLLELLHGALMSSANDAALAIGEGINGLYGDNIFISAMNRKVQFLGLKNTHFDSEEGFDSENNYSSASDLAILSDYALKNYPIISEISKKNYQHIATNSKSKWFDVYNWNGLLGVYPGVYGLKIGNTDDAGFTSAIVANRENKRVLVVILGAQGVLERDLLASQILDKSFKKLSGLESANISESDLRQKYATWK